jgi:aminoglycoside phosphotransferase (APT) family kinase protein
MTDFSDQLSAVRPGEEIDLARLEPFLRSHLLGCSGALGVEQFPSGHSNLTYLLHLGDRQVVLRRPPFGSKVRTAHDMGREYRVLSKLHPAYPPAPQVLLYCDDVSVLGAPFYLMKPIEGIILRRDPPAALHFPPETVRRLSESFIENLAALHGLDYAGIGLADLGTPEGYLERQVRGWIERYHGSKTHDLPEVGRLSAWLWEHLPSASEASLIHNDYKYDNVVLDSNDVTKVVGVLDWEMSTIGDPLSDLGTALAYWVDPGDPDELQAIRWGPTTRPGSLTRVEIVEHYVRATGRDVSRIAFFLVFAQFKVAVIVQQIYYRYHKGLTQDPRFAPLLEVTKVLLRAAWRSAQTAVI